MDRLIAAGADVNAAHPAAGGDTPLHVAIRQWRNSQMIELLIKEGADVNKSSADGETPMATACSGIGRPGVEKMLRDAGALDYKRSW